MAADLGSSAEKQLWLLAAPVATGNQVAAQRLVNPAPTHPPHSLTAEVMPQDPGALDTAGVPTTPGTRHSAIDIDTSDQTWEAQILQISENKNLCYSISTGKSKKIL